MEEQGEDGCAYYGYKREKRRKKKMTESLAWLLRSKRKRILWKEETNLYKRVRGSCPYVKASHCQSSPDHSTPCNILHFIVQLFTPINLFTNDQSRENYWPGQDDSYRVCVINATKVQGKLFSFHSWNEKMRPGILILAFVPILILI